MLLQEPVQILVRLHIKKYRATTKGMKCILKPVESLELESRQKKMLCTHSYPCCLSCKESASYSERKWNISLKTEIFRNQSSVNKYF